MLAGAVARVGSVVRVGVKEFRRPIRIPTTDIILTTDHISPLHRPRRRPDLSHR